MHDAPVSSHHCVYRLAGGRLHTFVASRNRDLMIKGEVYAIFLFSPESGHILAGRFVAFCWLTFVAVWVVGAFAANRKTARRATWGGSWLWLIVVGGLLLTSRERGSGLLRLALWSSTPTVGIVADVVTLAGVLVAVWARATLGGFWSSRVVLKQDHHVIERGPYRYVRHPIYSGVLLMMLGTAVLSGRLIAVFLLGIAFLLLWVKARREEQLLAEHLHESYARYQAQVRWLLIPFVF
jgi:protein-S-isoprenylcysteine O-methyltransferase Ste14